MLGLRATEEESMGADGAVGLKDICTGCAIPGGPGVPGVPGIPEVKLKDGAVGTHEVVVPILGADDRFIVELEEVGAGNEPE